MPASILKRVVSNNGDTTGPSQSISTVFGSAPTAGNMLIALHMTQDMPTINTPSGWTQIAQVSQDSFVDCRITAFARVAQSSEPTTVTVTIGGGVNKGMQLAIYELTSVTATIANILTATSLSSGSASTLTTGSVSPSGGAALLAMIGVGSNTATWANTWTNSFTQRYALSHFVTVADRIATAGGTYSTNETWGGGSPAASVILAIPETTGSTTTVSKSLGAAWGVSSIVAKSLTVLYNVEAIGAATQVSNSLIAKWNVAGALTQVSKSLTTKWNVAGALTQVSDSLIVKWNVAEAPAPLQIFVPTFVSVQDTISKSHRKTARIVVYDSINGRQIYESEDLLVPGGLITGGVNFGNSAIRRRTSLAFIDRTGVLTPGDANDIFSTYGHVVKVWRGVVVNGIDYEFPLGAFGITDVSVDDSGPGVQIAIEGYDYGDLLSRRGLIQDYTVPKGTNFGNAIQTLLQQQMPGIQFNFVTTSYTTPALFFQTNANAWEAAIMMAKAIGCDLFFDPNGVCTMRNVPDYSVAPVEYTYDEGAASTALYVNKRYTNRDAYNYFIVTGEHSGNATTGGGGPVRGDAYDDNPNSKTYWKGPYGTVPAPPVSSKLVTSTDQAIQAARGLLQNSIGRAERLHFNAIVNPLHEVGNVIQFTRAKSKIDNRYVIESGYIPLGHDQAMDLTTRVRQSLS